MSLLGEPQAEFEDVAVENYGGEPEAVSRWPVTRPPEIHRARGQPAVRAELVVAVPELENQRERDIAHALHLAHEDIHRQAEDTTAWLREGITAPEGSPPGRSPQRLWRLVSSVANLSSRSGRVVPSWSAPPVMRTGPW